MYLCVTMYTLRKISKHMLKYASRYGRHGLTDMSFFLTCNEYVFKKTNKLSLKLFLFLFWEQVHLRALDFFCKKHHKIDPI